MPRAEDNADEMIGQDSFLDVVTNIVGILILLVMVVGMRTTEAVETAAMASDDAPDATSSSVDENAVREAYNTANLAEKNVRDLIRRVVDINEEARLREHERTLLQTLVTQVEQEIASRREGLNVQDQRDFDLRRQLAEAQLTLDELTREQVAMLAREPEVEKIECEPTPFARKVTGDEVHLLLADDHVALVPFDELLERLKEDVNENIWRLRQQDELERTIGPFNGFRLRYWFVKAQVVARSDTGTVVAGQFPRFSHCYFLPVETPLGEPAAEAMRPNSELRQHLQRRNPHGTTVTIWTYPGNYDRLRELKRAIRELQFQIAVRPLPKGMPIGASSTGSESVTE